MPILTLIPETKLLIGGLIRIRKLEPIYPGATSLRNAADGSHLDEGNQGISDGVPRQLNQVSTAAYLPGSSVLQALPLIRFPG